MKTFILLTAVGILLSLSIAAIAIPGQAGSAQDSTDVPMLNATSADIATLPETESAPTLRSLAEKRNFYMGAAVAYVPLLDLQPYRDTLANEYNMVVPENAMKWDATEPAQNFFEFTEADLIVNFAKTNDMQIRGHNLVWYNALPSWLTSGTFTRAQLLNILHNHIQNVVTHYKGLVAAWDVVNEAIGDDGSLRQDLWLNVIGPDYIEQAFRFAHEADPQAKLYYNDYGGEGKGRKADAIYRLVTGLKAKGVPIDGVGLQMHVGLGTHGAPQPADVSANMDRLAAVGLDVQITEMDVKIQTGTGSLDDRLAAQATLYKNMLQVCLEHKTCTAFLTWGFTDQYSWLTSKPGQDEAPLPFDKDYQPKPAYQALMNVLATS